MLVSDAVEGVRSKLRGGRIPTLALLDAPYVPGSGTIVLRSAQTLRAGQIISAGINTLQITGQSTDMRTFSVIESADGSPDVALAEGTRVVIAPEQTTWAIVRELANEARGLSSRRIGLYMPWLIETYGVDTISGMYALPEREDNLKAQWLVKAEYNTYGQTTWYAFAEAEYQPNQGVVRVFADPPDAVLYRFTLALGFGVPENLDDDLDALGFTGNLSEILQLGAAATLILSAESRRVQAVTQSDPRRPGEVPVTSNSALSRQFRATQQERIKEERARLLAHYSNKASVAAPGGTSIGGRW